MRNFYIFIVRQLSASGESPVVPIVGYTAVDVLKKSLGAMVCFRRSYAGVAQLVEQLICNQQVIGPSPIASSRVTGEKYHSLREAESLLSRVAGQVAKRSNASDCKSDGSCLRRFESSPAHKVLGEGAVMFFDDFVELNAGVTQLVESQPSKLLVAGSSPVSRSTVSERLRSSVGRALPW